MLTLRFAIRQLLKSPGFTLVAILILALGIGMSTSAFSVTNLLLLRSMPYPQGDQLMRIFRSGNEGPSLPHSPGNFLDIRSSTNAFSGVAAYFLNTFNVAEKREPPHQEMVINATADFLRVLRIQPLLGRDFAVDEDQPGKARSVILAHSYWEKHYGGDPAAIGKTLRVGTQNLTIAGVLPKVFEDTAVWQNAGLIVPTTLWADSASSRQDKWYEMIGRLKPGASRANAQSELAVIAARMDHDFPMQNGNDQLRVVDLYASNTSATDRQGIWFVTIMSVLVVVIACANLAGVQVARAFSRSHEFAVRASLGANRRQLVTPLIVESLILSVLGGLGGFGVAYWENYFTAHFNASGSVSEIPIDGHVLLFAAAIAILAGLAFGLAPAALIARRSTHEALKQAAAGGVAIAARSRLKSFLIIGQWALALILVSAATSFGIAARRSLTSDYGWKAKNIYSATIGLPYAAFPDEKTKLVLVQALHERMGRLPGVTRVVLSGEVPLYTYYQQHRVVTEANQAAHPGQEPIAASNRCEGEFFDVLSIPLIDGRTFPANLKAGDPAVAIVNQTMARLLWPGQSPIGRRVRYAENAQWLEIIGVVGDVKMAGNFGAPNSQMQIYRPVIQDLDNYVTVLLDGSVSADSLEQPFRKALAEINPDITIYQSGGMATTIKFMLSSNNLSILVLSAFALVGLLISLVGLYGVCAQLTMQRTREIGVRVALGATRRSVVNLMLAQSSKLIFAGLAVGVVGSFFVHRFYRQTLPNLPVPNFAWELMLCLILMIAGFAACYLPAYRATRIDPIDALRAD